MTDRWFIWAKDFINTIDNSEYNNNDSVLRSGSDVIVIVADWDQIKTLDRTAIMTQAALVPLLSYEDH